MGTHNRHNVSFLESASFRKRKRKAMKRIKRIYKISKKANKEKSCHLVPKVVIDLRHVEGKKLSLTSNSFLICFETELYSPHSLSHGDGNFVSYRKTKVCPPQYHCRWYFLLYFWLPSTFLPSKDMSITTFGTRRHDFFLMTLLDIFQICVYFVIKFLKVERLSTTPVLLSVCMWIFCKYL